MEQTQAELRQQSAVKQCSSNLVQAQADALQELNMTFKAAEFLCQAEVIVEILEERV
jgi:hypothetical protein